jgi:hypothetical protein
VNDARSGLEAPGRIRTVVHDLGAELVAHHHVASRIHHRRSPRFQGGLDHQITVLQRVQVRAADPARNRANEDLSGAGLGLGHGVDDDLRVAHHRCAHVGSSQERVQGR